MLWSIFCSCELSKAPSTTEVSSARIMSFHINTQMSLCSFFVLTSLYSTEGKCLQVDVSAKEVTAQSKRSLVDSAASSQTYAGGKCLTCVGF